MSENKLQNFFAFNLCPIKATTSVFGLQGWITKYKTVLRHGGPKNWANNRQHYYAQFVQRVWRRRAMLVSIRCHGFLHASRSYCRRRQWSAGAGILTQHGTGSSPATECLAWQQHHGSIQRPTLWIVGGWFLASARQFAAFGRIHWHEAGNSPLGREQFALHTLDTLDQFARQWIAGGQKGSSGMRGVRRQELGETLWPVHMRR